MVLRSCGETSSQTAELLGRIGDKISACNAPGIAGVGKVQYPITGRTI